MSFDFSSYMHQVCDKAISQNEELAHIDLSKIVIAFAQARKRVPHGLFASLTPLRFANGAKEEVRRKRKVTIQRIVIREEEMLYILRFYLPRFWDLDFREKLITVFHELWHISPNCDGDIRRHAVDG